jgi:hypothetical protein
MHEVLRDSEKFTVVSLYKLFKGADISTLAGMDQGQVIICRFFHRELC